MLTRIKERLIHSSIHSSNGSSWHPLICFTQIQSEQKSKAAFAHPPTLPCPWPRAYPTRPDAQLNHMSLRDCLLQKEGTFCNLFPLFPDACTFGPSLHLSTPSSYQQRPKATDMWQGITDGLTVPAVKYCRTKRTLVAGRGSVRGTREHSERSK